MAADKRKSLLILLDLKQKELDQFRRIQQQMLNQTDQFETILAGKTGGSRKPNHQGFIQYLF